MTTPTAIKVKMIDLFTGELVERTIDISNFSVPDYTAPDGWECNVIATNKEQQVKLLNSWIEQRANPQHDTVLSLESFEVI